MGILRRILQVMLEMQAEQRRQSETFTAIQLSLETIVADENPASTLELSLGPPEPK